MFINSELIDRSTTNYRQNKLPQVNSAMNFQKVLEGVSNQQAVETAFSSEQKNVNKRKKNTMEIMGDYKEEIESVYDVLNLQSKIRKIFRKIRIQQIS